MKGGLVFLRVLGLRMVLPVRLLESTFPEFYFWIMGSNARSWVEGWLTERCWLDDTAGGATLCLRWYSFEF